MKPTDLTARRLRTIAEFRKEFFTPADLSNSHANENAKACNNFFERESDVSIILSKNEP